MVDRLQLLAGIAEAALDGHALGQFAFQFDLLFADRRLAVFQALAQDRAALLELFELTGWRDSLVESFSHGMRQRLIMCAAFLHRPRAVVVDEPMVGLDPRGARLIKEIFRVQSRKGVAVLMSTHTLEVAQEMCDRISIIQNGRIIASGTASS